MPARLSPARLACFVALLACLVLPAVGTVAAARPDRPDQVFSVDSDLRSPSGLTAWSIDQVLAGVSPWRNLGTSFLSAERRSHVNARFLVGMALHESGFGTSALANDKNNLFGYNAFDRNPYGMATAFPSKAKAILTVADFLDQNYLTPTGRYFSGTTPRAVGSLYASDPDWARKIVAIIVNLHFPSLPAVSLGAPSAVGLSHAGQPLVLTTALAGAIAPGLRVAATFTDLSGHGPAQTTSAAITADQNGQLTVSVSAPAASGRYGVQLDLRDSDGSALPARQASAAASGEVQLYGDHEVGYDLASTADGGVAVTITNLGRQAIAALPGKPAALSLYAFASQPDAAGLAAAQAVPAALPGLPAPSLPHTAILAVDLPDALPAGQSVTIAVPAAALATAGAGPHYVVAELQAPGWPASSSAGWLDPLLTNPAARSGPPAL